MKCPRCQGILEVTNPKNEPVLLITCPNPQCQAKIRINFDSGETQISNKTAANAKVGYLRCKGKNYELQEGLNIVGRKATSSKATIQIDTDGRSMSREHAEIKVVRLKSGRVKALLRDIRPVDKMTKKPTMVEDEPLEDVDIITLSNGDMLLMGDTRLKYVQE